MTGTKMTKKDKFRMIASILAHVADEGLDAIGIGADYDVVELEAFCESEIALLEKKAAKAKETAKAKKAEADELMIAVEGVLAGAEDFMTIAEVTDAIEGEDVTTAKVAYRLGALVKAEKAVKQEKTIPGGEGVKARKVQSYKLV